MSVKYLRVVLDSQLTLREYVDVTVRKAHNLFQGLQEGLWCNVGPKNPKWSNGSTSLCITPSRAIKALNDLPPLDLVTQDKARSAVLHL